MPSTRATVISGLGLAAVSALALFPALAVSLAEDLELRAAFSAKTVPPDAIRVTLTMANVSTFTFTVFSHVETHERHYDPFRIELAYPTPSAKGCGPRRTGRKTRKLSFVDDRDRSAPVDVELRPGAAVTHTIDLGDWARRKVNGAVPLGPGYYKVRAVYDARPSRYGVWSGELASTEVRVVVSGTPARDMCPKNPGWEVW